MFESILDEFNARAGIDALHVASSRCIAGHIASHYIAGQSENCPLADGLPIKCTPTPLAARHIVSDCIFLEHHLPARSETISVPCYVETTSAAWRHIARNDIVVPNPGPSIFYTVVNIDATPISCRPRDGIAADHIVAKNGIPSLDLSAQVHAAALVAADVVYNRVIGKRHNTRVPQKGGLNPNSPPLVKSLVTVEGIARHEQLAPLVDPIVLR